MRNVVGKVMLAFGLVALLSSSALAQAADRKVAATPAVAQVAQPALPMVDDLAARLSVRQRLASLGLSSAEAEARVDALTPSDISKLKQNPEQIAMAGIKDTTLIIIAVVLVVPSLLLLLVI